MGGRFAKGPGQGKTEAERAMAMITKGTADPTDDNMGVLLSPDATAAEKKARGTKRDSEGANGATPNGGGRLRVTPSSRGGIGPGLRSPLGEMRGNEVLLRTENVQAQAPRQNNVQVGALSGAGSKGDDFMEQDEDALGRRRRQAASCTPQAAGGERLDASLRSARLEWRTKLIFQVRSARLESVILVLSVHTT